MSDKNKNQKMVESVKSKSEINKVDKSLIKLIIKKAEDTFYK